LKPEVEKLIELIHEYADECERGALMHEKIRYGKEKAYYAIMDQLEVLGIELEEEEDEQETVTTGTSKSS
jgi:hypothetical protein